MDIPPFVPAGFQPPRTLDSDNFRLEPLGPQHNDSDHVAWMTSIPFIRSLPGFSASWPPEDGMSIEANLKDLVEHAADFDQNKGFTFTVLDPNSGFVIGCVYIYPTKEQGFDAGVKSWVTADYTHLDAELADSVAAWLAADWPWDSVYRYGR